MSEWGPGDNEITLVFNNRDGRFTARGAAFEDVLARYRTMPHWTCWICGSTWLGDITHDCPAAKKPDPALQHWLMVKMAKAFRVRPHQIGLYPPCACHPAPNPAARDYRRRTKHRNRRKR